MKLTLCYVMIYVPDYSMKDLELEAEKCQPPLRKRHPRGQVASSAAACIGQPLLCPPSVRGHMGLTVSCGLQPVFCQTKTSPLTSG